MTEYLGTQTHTTAKPANRPIASGALQRQCACGQHTSAGGECEGCKKQHEGMLQRAAISPAPVHDVPPIVHEVPRSSGQPLDAATRAFMAPKFRHDFSSVRVHTDAKAAESARAVNALAYTVGHDVVFGAGQYAPHTTEGKRLVIHELIHSVQQEASAARTINALTITSPNDTAEREAESTAHTMEHSSSYSPINDYTAQLARQADTETETPQPAPIAAAAPVQISVDQDAGTCAPSMPGLAPSTGNCSAYLANSWWLPMAYVNNAACACLTTPNSQTANCVRKFLQDRLAATPVWLKTVAALQKPNDNPVSPAYPAYQAFVQSTLTPRIYQDHVDAYANCCCSSGPAPYSSWIGVTTVPIQPCSLVGLSIRYFGSCHGTPGSW